VEWRGGEGRGEDEAAAFIAGAALVLDWIGLLPLTNARRTGTVEQKQWAFPRPDSAGQPVSPLRRGRAHHNCPASHSLAGPTYATPNENVWVLLVGSWQASNQCWLQTVHVSLFSFHAPF
jgi:hypothetical protein